MDYLKKINLDKIRNVAEDVINQAKPKSEVESRIYEALSHKNWGSSSTLMNEISRDTFDYEKYATITKIIWESLQNQRPAAWRVVFKALTLLEHLIKNGSERCVDDARNHSHLLRNLFNFNYYEGTTDRGIGVREKSKQLVELLGDDERVREERMKAKQLREKFGGNLGGVSSSGGGYSGGGGSGGSSYAGYGNDDYGGFSGGSSGYADSGIGSNSGYSGRYNDTNNETSTSSIATGMDATPAPTFAAVPEKKKKKSKKSKKKKEKTAEDGANKPVAAIPETAPETPEVDLLSMDDPAPSGNVGFDAFQTSEPPFDAFGVSSGGSNAQQQTNTTKMESFDAFGEMTSTERPSQSQQLRINDQFDAFSSAPTLSAQQKNSFDAFGHNNNANSMNDMFGKISLGKIPKNNNNIMDGGRTNKNVQDDDDFGDFADGTTTGAKSKIDPLSNLISLDGLKKNSKKEDKTSEPILFNQAAKDYADNQNQIKAESLKVSADFAFSGVDGLNKVSTTSQPQMSRAGNQPIMMNIGGNNEMNSMNSMGMYNMSNSMNSMGTMMNSNNDMNAFGNNSVQMNSMSMMGGNSGMNNMGVQQQDNMMMGVNNMIGGNGMGMGRQGNNMIDGNVAGMSGQQQRSMMMGGNSMGMGGQQGNHMMGGQKKNNMMGGQPMGGGW